MKQSMPQAKIMEVNAAIAQEFLRKERAPQAGVGGTNRKFSSNIVREYADAMLRGEWVLTHQGIAFTGENEGEEMIDGGHRLRAVILADAERPGIKVPFMVTYGISSEAMIAMDIGKRRVPADFLTMQGQVNVTSLSGILRLSYCYFNVPYIQAETWSRTRITPTMQKDYLDKNPMLIKAVYETFPLKKLFKSSALGAFWFIVKAERPDVNVEEFLEQLRTGELLAKGDPALTLRELMLNARGRGQRYSAPEELALLIKAFNKWVRQEESYVLSFRSDENFPRV